MARRLELGNAHHLIGYRQAVALLVVAGLWVLFWGLGSIPLMSVNEARRALPIVSMIESHDWLLPRLDGKLYIDKPPLFYWLGAALAEAAGGGGEWIVRLPSALAGCAALAIVHVWARVYLGRPEALAATAILMTAATFAMFARRAEIEMLLTALSTGSLLAAHHYTRQGGVGWLIAGFVALGLAVLAKGPVALLYVILPLLVWSAMSGDRKGFGFLGSILGWSLFVVVAGSWFLWVTAELGVDVWRKTVAADIGGKVYGAESDPFYYYVFWVLTDFCPWSLLFFAMPAKAFSPWRKDPSIRFLLYAVAAPLLVFSLFANKHAKYLLPAYPVFALLLGSFAVTCFRCGGRLTRRLLMAGWILMPILYGVYFSVVEPRVYAYRFDAFPAVRRALDDFPAAPVYAYRRLDLRTVYYAGRRMKIVGEPELDGILRKGPALLWVERSEWLPPLQATGWCRLETFRPYLKRDRSAFLLGNDEVCASAGAARSFQRERPQDVVHVPEFSAPAFHAAAHKGPRADRREGAK